MKDLDPKNLPLKALGKFGETVGSITSNLSKLASLLVVNREARENFESSTGSSIQEFFKKITGSGSDNV